MHSSISGDLYVDGTKPEVSINSITPEYLSKDGTLAIDYETSDDLSGLCQTDITILNNKGETVLIDKITNGSGALEYICSGLDSLKNGGDPEEGSYLIIIATVDKAGNKKVVMETDAIIVDNTAPDFPVSIEGISYSLDDNLLNKKEITDELIINYDDEIRVNFHNTDSYDHYYPHPVIGDVVTIYSDYDPEINSVQLNSSDIEKGYVDIKIPSNYFAGDGSDDGEYNINAKITDKAGNCNGGINSPYEMRVDTTPPKLISAAAVDAYHVVLTMDEKLLSYRLPTGKDNLNIMVEGNNYSNILDVNVSGSKVTLVISTTTSDRDITEGSSIKMNYWPIDYRYSNKDDTYFADRAGNIMPRSYVDVENRL